MYPTEACQINDFIKQYLEKKTMKIIIVKICLVFVPKGVI